MKDVLALGIIVPSRLQGAGRGLVVECSLMVRWIVGLNYLGGPIYCSSQFSTTCITKAVSCRHTALIFIKKYTISSSF